WDTIKRQYRHLRKTYESSLNMDVRKKARKMFSKDQWKALGALFKWGPKAQDRYATKIFAPHSEKQMIEFLRLFKTYGYPGERLIGNNFWMSTLLSHHNSISLSYNERDTLYPSLRPKLWKAVIKGEMSAFEFALVDEWYRAVTNNGHEPTYGILEAPLAKDLTKTNLLRESVYLRSIEVHNKLVAIEEKTGMRLYLDGHPWGEDSIEIKSH
ncbi:MAG: hypothetical protein AB3N16_11885, partial [Flavobacteriaceae bacterium]